MDCCSHIAKLPAQRIARSATGFTLVEAISALTITAMAASVVLLAMETSLETASEAVEQTIAQGLAEQIVDEALGLRYVAPGSSPYQYPLSPNNWEKNGNGRERYNDFDDFHGFTTKPMTDRFGMPLGQGDGAGGLRHPALRLGDDAFRRWRVSIRVVYVAESDISKPLPAGDTSNFRMLEVLIQHRSDSGAVRELARARRVVSYLPPPA